MKSKKISVAYLRNPFLDYSSNFIFEEIASQKGIHKIVISTNKKDDIDFGNLKICYNEKYSKLCTINYPFIKKIHIKLFIDFMHFCIENIKKEKINILHAEFGTDGLFFLKLKRETNLPMVISFRGFDLYSFHKSNPKCYKNLFYEADLFLVRSEQMKENLFEIGCPKNKIFVTHTCIYPYAYHFRVRNFQNKSEIKLLFVGRFIEKKGISDLIKSMKILNNKKKSINKYFLTIIGSGHLENVIYDQIKKLKLSKSVVLSKPMKHNVLIDELDKHDILIVPSKTASNGDKEGIPVILIEGMCSGLPVISTKHSAISELVEDNVNGFLVNEGDPIAIAEKIEYVISHPCIQEISNNALAKIKKDFNLNIQTKVLKNYYSSLLKK